MKYFTSLFAFLLLTFNALAAIPYFTGYQTNKILLSYASDTNVIVVYDVGDVSSRGTYYFKDMATGNIFRYTNSSANGRMVAYDPLQNDFGVDNSFAITNGAGLVLYGTTSQLLNPPENLPQVFNRVSGTVGNGTITWGTNVTQNVFPAFVSLPYDSPLPLVQSNYLYVRTNGNDLTATRGRTDLPWRTVRRAFTNAVAGDVVFVGAGHFTNDFDGGGGAAGISYPLIQFPPRFVVKGSGIGVTFMDGLVNSSAWHLGNSNCISDFTATNIWFSDAAGVASTNIEIHDIEAVAQGDVIVLYNSIGMVSIWNCRLGGNSDKIADLSAFPSYQTNTIIDIENVTIFGGPGAADGIPDGLNAGGLMSWRGGGIHVNVDGASWEEHILTNGVSGKPVFTGPGSFIFAPQLVRTNWIGGQLYTNFTSGSMEIKGVSVLTEAAVTGGARQQLWVYNKSMLGGGLGTTNQHARQTTAATSAGTNAVTLSAWIPSGYVFAFTNLSGGGGNSAIVLDGTYFIP